MAIVEPYLSKGLALGTGSLRREKKVEIHIVDKKDTKGGNVFLHLNLIVQPD
jgi:hypothetical protein